MFCEQYDYCKAEECAIQFNSRIKQNIAAFLHSEGIRMLNAYYLLDAQSIKTSLVQMKGKENCLSLFQNCSLMKRLIASMQTRFMLNSRE